MRTLSGIILALVGLFVLAYLFFQDPGSAEASSSPWISSSQCQECHREIFGQWKKSQHARAWTNPESRKLSNNFSNADCISCHAPKPVFETGVGNRVLPRLSRRVEGVDCITCHASPHGMAGPNPAGSAKCKPYQDLDISKPLFCGSCHNQHGTVDEWEKTPFAQQGISCVSCHMSKDSSGKNSHWMTGAHSREGLKPALTIESAVEDRKAKIEIQNTGAGHDFPTDQRHRAVDLKYRLTLEGKTGEWIRLARFRDPYRDDQFDFERTTIPYGEKRSFEVPLPKGKGVLEFALYYKLNPFASDEEATLMYSKSWPFEF